MPSEGNHLGVTAAIRYLYCFEFPRGCCYQGLDSIRSFVVCGAVADWYEITALSELILRVASRALDDCLSDEDKLGAFFGAFDFIGSDGLHFAVKIIKANVNKLRKRACFQALLQEEHELAIELFNFVAEKQALVQGGREDLD